ATGSVSTTEGNASIVGEPTSSSVIGVLGKAVNTAGVMGSSTNSFGGLFVGGGGGVLAITFGSPGIVINSSLGAAALEIEAGRIVKPRVTGHYIKVWPTATPDQYEYEFV